MTLPKGTAERELVERVSQWIPRFQDLFDEESFYIFVFMLIILSVVAACVMSKFYVIKDAGHVD
jgi:hypothetical protein